MMPIFKYLTNRYFVCHEPLLRVSRVVIITFVKNGPYFLRGARSAVGGVTSLLAGASLARHRGIVFCRSRSIHAPRNYAHLPPWHEPQRDASQTLSRVSRRRPGQEHNRQNRSKMDNTTMAAAERKHGRINVQFT